jgi:NNP family nitrate/nitrite transporter-like MFS transporter
MPAIYDSLVHSQGLTPHRAWRVAYVVPFIIIIAIALSMLFLCDDTPTGKWSQRQGSNPVIQSNIVDLHRSSGSGAASSTNVSAVPEKKGVSTPQIVDTEAQPVIDLSEVIQKPTVSEALRVIFCLPTVAVALQYACSFGAELAINSILGAYYLKNFPSLGQTKSGRWAAMFGLVNVVFRPAGGFVADLIYRYTKSVWGKKVWLVCLGVCIGASALAVGLLDPHSEGLMFGLVVLMAFFIAASNGANFAIVPHVHPTANGKSHHLSIYQSYANRSRRCLGHCRRNGKLWWNRLCYHLPLQRHTLRSGSVDHRGDSRRDQPLCFLD